MTTFYDSIRPTLIPASATHVAGYANGAESAWPEDAFGKFPRYIKISVLPGRPELAKLARGLDIENHDASAADFPPFARTRHAHGLSPAVAYCSLSVIPDVVRAMTADTSTPWRIWAAWYWGRPYAPTAAEVAAELKTLTGLELPPGRLWAVQWRAGTDYDTSKLYGIDDFTRS